MNIHSSPLSGGPLSISDIALLLNCRKSTAYSLVKSGIISGTTINGRHVVTMDDLALYRHRCT